MNAPAHSKPVRLAALALHHAVEQDWPKATRAVDQMNRECGPEGLGTALVAWCDAFAQHAHGGKAEFQKIRLVSMDVDSGRIGIDLPPRAQWAQELIHARVEGDLERFQAKLAQLRSINDGYERGRWVSALIEAVAITIRTFPYGYASIGKQS